MTKVEELLEERVRQQAAVAEISRRALEGIELSALMDQTAVLVTQTLGVEFCKILELSPNKQTLLLRAGAGWKEGCVGVATVSAGAKSQAGYTLLSKTPIIVEDLKTETRFSGPPLLADHNVASGLSVIIGHQDRPYGVLGAHTKVLRAFTKDDIHFLEAVATMLFQVIEHDNDMKQIRRSANWLERLIHTTQDAVISIDRRGCVVLFNAAAERVFGYKSGEIFGRKVNDLMAEPYASEHDGYIARYERTGEPRAIGRIRTVEGRRKNGEVFPLELSVTEIEVDQDVHYAAFIRDISEKTRLQTQLMESERLAMIGTTAAKIGHELANPLNGMSLTIQLLEQRLNRQPSAADGQILSTVKRLKDEIARLNKLVGQFATISRREKYVFRPANLAELIDDVVKMQEPHFAQLGIELTKSIAGDLPNVSIDADKLKQAVLNLLKNSGEATPHGGKISINAFAVADTVIIEVADTGTGIPLDIDAFEPFVTTKKEGTGIGLVVVRQILAAHGGNISYRSQPGKGTTFRIELPPGR
jgi:PAS domain S-box-containing protein